MPFRVDPMLSTGRQTVDNSPAIEKNAPEFGNTLDRVQKLQQREFESFLSRLDSLGQRLADSLSLTDLAAFKQMARDFLRSTLGQSRKMREDSFWDPRGQHKVLARVTQIDKALDELGEKVLSEHAKSLDILAKIGEIRGLLIDLLA
ncbi:hypothetical protein CEB3_c17130 [Peptococcaceae bacterium CEB3]|nr:hypothetical protein CEB3_c17130 [Peptococcaceae bacterium CEB3]